MKQSSKTSVLLSMMSGVGFLTGCGRAPSFNILGSFFPAWLICMVIGIALAVVVHLLLVRFKREKLIAWGIVTYPSLAALFAFTMWLIFFS
jgi:membrane glycosyltransferase